MNIYHQLDQNVNPVKYDGENFYPLSVIIEDNNNIVKIKSKISNFFNIYSCELDKYVNNNKIIKESLLSNNFRLSDLNNFTRKEIFPFYHLLNDETSVVKKIIELKKSDSREKYTVDNDFQTEFEKYTSEITELIDSQIKETYKEEVKRIFIKSIDNEDDKEIFNLTNYLLHYINWDNSFFNFYETTTDLIYAPIKNLENRFDNSFKTQLKAFLAYHSKVNVLKRFFEKRELGKITTISYLDWITDIRDFLMVEFEKIFGEQKAIQFIVSIDHLLQEALGKKLG